MGSETILHCLKLEINVQNRGRRQDTRTNPAGVCFYK